MLNAVGQAQRIALFGGTSEIGLGIVTEFLKRGPAEVVLAARSASPRVDAAVEKLRDAGASEVTVVDFDARETDQHPEVVDQVFAGGDVDIAIVAFGTLGDQEKLWQDHAAAVESAEINFTGYLSVGVLLGQKLKEQGHGHLVALSSVAGMRVRRSNFVYGASKAGVDGFYSQLGVALEDSGVHVLVVRPGQVRTKMSADVEKEAPFTVDVSDVAEATVEAVLAGKDSIFVHRNFGPISLILRNIPHKIMKKLSF
ncbi:decaprenylphospho-beta-D-erythro-pentofuranosid-2-ulose 2-reductase [Corynebacterium yudongzhengii]|uniref:Decaprenylphospho-beta-D-erythro-pentofuranosid-2-ulose 2-reductase n=1 Tax=Corynebacterium yudongzhengii TaxID=2080740 RepID=A0A2U1T5I4_9CORY|nr:decaprenylphospho-beta-D-erythro-pentofuranosid-2-ulose 2-reductase [Corynebacterium yudongzhengii]AWB81022.1 decaprenylphospho-beta-D-erythro-pentofuranosid-2-ulose 2-reductase [Corynebacterium yudongzhengii]PWC01267.1 decaprenylphospho-beta-D-erythro-pentofuranosid-2-ulose 2-reductase [Corynebacterium yudongzhengii]